jgi:hypothetical protein
LLSDLACFRRLKHWRRKNSADLERASPPQAIHDPQSVAEEENPSIPITPLVQPAPSGPAKSSVPAKSSPSLLTGASQVSL